MENFNLKIAAVKGFTKEEALSIENVGFDSLSIKGSNSTQAWVKAGKPTYGTAAFKAFAAEQLKSKTRGAAGVGCYVIIEAGVSDSRERPYKVISVSNEGTRKYQTVYQVVEADIKRKLVKGTKLVTVTDEDGVETEVEKETTEIVPQLLGLGSVVDTADKKGDAITKAKELTARDKRDYVVHVAKITDHNPIAAYSLYTPSTSAKEGTYIAFGVEL